MSAFMAESALTSFAPWRSNSNGVFAPREVGKPPAARPIPVEEVEDVERRDPQVPADVVRGAVGRGFVCVNSTGAVGCTR